MPYVIVAVLRFLLRQYGFRANVGGPKTFTRIIMRFQIKMNLQMLIYIESISIKLKFPATFTEFFSNQTPFNWILIEVQGLQINILLKDDFETWSSQKIELLQIINQMREKLTRLGLLKTNLRQRIDEANLQNAEKLDNTQSQDNSNNNKINAYRNMLLHFQIKLTETQCNFFVYKIDSQDQSGTIQKDLDSNNLREFHTIFIRNKIFQQRYLCFRLHAPTGIIQISRMLDDQFDLDIKINKLLLQQPNHKHKCGLLNQVEIQLKVPTSGKLMSDFCNFELRIQIQDGLLNINKKFMQNFLNFFVYFDTLLTIIKNIRKLVLRQHFQDGLMYEIIRQNRKGAVLNQPIFANYRDTAIPKRFQILIFDGLHFLVSDENQTLKPFLIKNPDAQSLRQSQMVYVKLCRRTTFEMARTLKDSYYLNFQCEKFEIDVNGVEAIKATGFVQELDLTFMREVTPLPVKLSRMIVEQKIEFQNLNINMTPPLLKVLYEVMNFYHKSKFIASIKHKIIGKLSDKNFLLTNIIATSNNTEIRLSDEQILEIYEQPKHQDRISTSFCVVKQTKISFYTQDQAVYIQGHSNNTKFTHNIENGTNSTSFECANLTLEPLNTKQQQYLPFVKAINLVHQKFLILPTSPLNKEGIMDRVQYLKTSALKFQLALNLEIILDHYDEILNYTFIQKVFKRKWGTKYNITNLIQNSYKNDVTTVNGRNQFSYSQQNQPITYLNAFYFQEAMLLWNMSQKRIMCLSLTEFRPISESVNAYHEQLGKDLPTLVLNKVFHKIPCYKDKNETITIKQTASTGQLIHRYVNLSEDQLIIDSKQLEWHQLSTKEHQDFKFRFAQTEMNVPHDFHFGSFISECTKQTVHTGNWFRRQYKLKKQTLKFQFKNYPIPEEFNSSSRNLLKNIKKPRTLNLSLEYEKGKVSMDENPLNLSFVVKNDIVETATERDILKLKPRAIYNLTKKLKSSKIYQKYFVIEMDKYKIQWSKPPEFQSDQAIYDRITQLDEADQFLSRDIFSEIKGSIHQHSASYFVLHCRSHVKPLLELWGLDFQIQAITGIMNPRHNPSFFTEQIEQKIFQKFSIPITFNKMTNKLYHDASIVIQKMNMAIQGQQSLLFFQDFNSFAKRLFIFEDISKSLDPKKKLLPYFVGLDRHRNKNHGKVKIKIPNTCIEIWPYRRINRYTNKLILQLLDFEFGQKNILEKERLRKNGNPALLQHLLCLRSMTLSRGPIKQFESALINFPLIELQLYTNYNRGTTMNHYLHQQTTDMASYLTQLHAFVTKEFYIEIKLNLPSFGTVNPIKRSQLFLPQLMQSYVANSPVPIINYQRSYLQLLDEILKEYFNGGKRDISGRVLKKYNDRINPQIIVKSETRYDFQIKCNAFLSDILFLFTDFEEARDIFGEENIDNQIIEPEEIEDDRKRDSYLARYQGLMFSVSNACLQTTVEVLKGTENRTFRSLSTFYKSNFMRLAAINSRNLFNIRFSNVKVNQPGTMDNYRIFQNFFEIDRTSNDLKNSDLDYETLLNGFKTLFPQYVLNNEQIQHAINEAQGHYDSFDDFNEGFRSSSQIYSDDRDLSIEEYFNFNEDDTIAIISRTNYSQNKAIRCSKNTSFENQSKDFTDQAPIQIITEQSPLNSDEIIVRHCLEFEKVRLLCTNKIQELLVHHLIRGFNFKQFRKTDYVDLIRKNTIKPTRDFLNEYRLNESLASQKNKQPKSEQQYHLKKEAFFALVLIDPQISCQNNLSQSQLLFALDSTTTAVIHAYSVNSQSFQRNEDRYFDMIAMTNLMVKDVVKYELCINIKNMDCFVATTRINSEHLTFWASSCQKNFDTSDWEQELRKILQVEDTSIQICLLNDTLVDNHHPNWAIDLNIQKISCETDGPCMWHAYCVFQMILLNRGEKSTELVFIEEAKQRDLTSFKINQLRDLIDRELKQTQFKLGVDNIRPDLARRVEYKVKTFEFTFYNYKKQFSSGLIENISGKHRIYLNRESNSDVDVDRITLKNHCDTDEYRMVLYPSNFGRNVFQKLEKDFTHKNIGAGDLEDSTTMIKLRARDKFVVVNEAPWKVYDQIEIFIHPASIQLTRNFYQQFKVFFFENNPLTDIKEGQTKKYSFMTTARVLQKQLKKMTIEKSSQIKQFETVNTERDSYNTQEQIIAIEQNDPLSITPRTNPLSPKQSQDLTLSQSMVVISNNTKNYQKDGWQEFPNFFRYVRINEIQMKISYFHAPHHLLNIKDFKLKMPPFISHGTFTTFRKTLESYESHIKRNFISQIPNLFMRKTIQVKEKVKDMKVDDLIEEQQTAATKQEMKLAYAKKIIHGDFAI